MDQEFEQHMMKSVTVNGIVTEWLTPPGASLPVTVAPSLCRADVVLAKETQQYVVPSTTPTEMESLWTDVSIGTSQFTRSYILASAAHAWKGVLVYCPFASLK